MLNGKPVIECGPADNRGERVVFATYKTASHRDRFNTDSAFKRQKFIEVAIGRFGLDARDNALAIERQIVEAADKEDDQSFAAEPIEKFTFAELREQYVKMKPPVVDGLVRQGETCNLIAASKVGKSWIGYSLLLSIATGNDWLGRFPTAQGRVLLIDNELHRPTLANRVPLVAAAMDLFPDDYQDAIDVWPLRGNLRSINELAAEFEALEQNHYKLILFDAKYRFATGGQSENDNAAETLFYNRLDQLAEQTGAALVLIHHSSKGNQSGKAVTDVGSGAGAQSRAADCHLVLREHEDEGLVVLDAAVRSFAPVRPLALRWQFPLWVADLSADASKLKGNLTGQERKQQERDKEGKAEIIKALLKESLTARKLRICTGISKDRLDRLVSKLLGEEQIIASPITIKGNESFEYSIKKMDVVD